MEGFLGDVKEGYQNIKKKNVPPYMFAYKVKTEKIFSKKEKMKLESGENNKSCSQKQKGFQIGRAHV